MIVNVGLVTSCVIPSPDAMPLTRHVLPEPSSPLSATTSPARNSSARVLPKAIVSVALCVSTDCEMVIASRRQSRFTSIAVDELDLSARFDDPADFSQRQLELPSPFLS